MNEQELNPTNGWQNIGIMVQYARKNVAQKNRQIFIDIVQESFGYSRAKTLHKTQKHWAELFSISEKTFYTHVNKLAEDGHIKINHKKGYVAGGGSTSYSYSPVFPSHANIFLAGSEGVFTNVYVRTMRQARWRYEVIERANFIQSSNHYEITKAEYDAKKIIDTEQPTNEF